MLYLQRGIGNYLLEMIYLYISSLFPAVVECDSLPSPDNGNIEYTGDSEGQLYEDTVANYVCDMPYTLSNAQTRTCVNVSGVGTWSGDAQTCDG